MSVQIINTGIQSPVQSETSSNISSDQGEQFADVIQQANSDKSDKSMSGNDASSASNAEAHASVKNEKNKNQSTDDKDEKDEDAAKNTELLSGLAMQLILANLPKRSPEISDEKQAQKEGQVNSSAAAKPVQSSQSMQQMQKMLTGDAAASKAIGKDSAQILADQATVDAKQATSVAISGSSSQAWQIAQANALSKMGDLAQPALAKTDNQKVILSEIKQIKNEKQPLDSKLAQMALEKATQQSAPLSQSDKNEAQIAGAQSAQDFQAVFAKQNTVPMNDQQAKTAQAVSDMGNVIQAQVSAALSNQSSITNNQSLESKPEIIDTQMKKYNYEMTVELSKDPIDATIKESYATNIKIYPPDLGSVLARLKVDKNSTQLVLVTENDRVKGIVEANLPQLREHFQQSNITLTHVEVQTASSGSGDQFAGKQQANGEFISNSQTVDTPAQAQASTEPQKKPNKIIDTYA